MFVYNMALYYPPWSPDCLMIDTPKRISLPRSRGELLNVLVKASNKKKVNYAQILIPNYFSVSFNPAVFGGEHRCN
jgi:hypothetical protein